MQVVLIACVGDRPCDVTLGMCYPTFSWWESKEESLVSGRGAGSDLRRLYAFTTHSQSLVTTLDN